MSLACCSSRWRPRNRGSRLPRAIWTANTAQGAHDVQTASRPSTPRNENPRIDIRFEQQRFETRAANLNALSRSHSKRRGSSRNALNRLPCGPRRW